MSTSTRDVAIRQLEIDIGRKRISLMNLIRYKGILTKMLESSELEEKYYNMVSLSKSMYELPCPTTLRKKYLQELGIVKSKIHSEEIELKELCRRLDYNMLCKRLGM